MKYLYITNDERIASIIQEAGVDRVFVDMEHIGKADRQGGMDTVQSHHKIEDIARLRPIVNKGGLLARINPIHEGSKAEIEGAISAGADVLMLPFFKTVDEVKEFIELTAGRAITCPLVETPQAVTALEKIVALNGIDEIYFGLNDLHLGYGLKFIYELLANGTVERLCKTARDAKIPYGFGGIAQVGSGNLPAECIMGEHIRLGSSMVILSRSFYNTQRVTDIGAIGRIFTDGIRRLNETEAGWKNSTAAELEQNRLRCIECVKRIVG